MFWQQVNIGLPVNDRNEVTELPAGFTHLLPAATLPDVTVVMRLELQVATDK